MKTVAVVVLSGLMLFSTPILAADQHLSTGYAGQQNGEYSRPQNGGYSHPQSGNSNNADVVVDMPPEVWAQGQNNNQPACNTCCTFEDRQYTEGAVVKSEGVLLQCARDEKSLGTNNRIWKIVKQ